MDRLDHIEEIEYCKAAQNGDSDAMKKMIEGNLGLVAKLAHKMYFKNPQFTFEDLYQEGVFGLIRAIEKFDCTRGCRFSTYAYPWIRAFLGRYNQDHRGKIRIPSHINDKLSKMEKDSEEYKKLKSVIPCVLSLSDPIGESSTISDVVADQRDYQESLEISLLVDKMKEVLTEREYEVICHRFGINYIPKTHRECAKIFDVTYGTIFNIEKKAIMKLKKVFA